MLRNLWNSFAHQIWKLQVRITSSWQIPSVLFPKKGCRLRFKEAVLGKQIYHHLRLVQQQQVQQHRHHYQQQQQQQHKRNQWEPMVVHRSIKRLIMSCGICFTMCLVRYKISMSLCSSTVVEILILIEVCDVVVVVVVVRL